MPLHELLAATRPVCAVFRGKTPSWKFEFFAGPSVSVTYLLLCTGFAKYLKNELKTQNNAISCSSLPEPPSWGDRSGGGDNDVRQRCGSNTGKVSNQVATNGTMLWHRYHPGRCLCCDNVHDGRHRRHQFKFRNRQPAAVFLRCNSKRATEAATEPRTCILLILLFYIFLGTLVKYVFYGLGTTNHCCRRTSCRAFAF